MTKQEKWILGVVLGLLLIDLWIVVIANLTPKIYLKKENMTLLLNETYQEPGYSAKKGFQDLTKDVKVENYIDNKKIGTYQVVYELNIHGKRYRKVRKVTVVDQTKPVITLKGSNPAIVCPGKEYQEEGYTGLDNYDGDLTKQIKVQKEKNFILYTLKDQSGNVSEIKREIQYQDKDAPVIHLTGGNSYFIYLGESYKEPGYQAIDSCDGDITKNVKVSGNVNSAQKGNYEITYEVSDTTGKSTKVTRIVTVVGPKPTNGKVIYLTFDDGPSSSITPMLLDILKEENVKATFFVLNHGTGLDYLIRREYLEGHTVALHSSSHNYRQIYRSSTAFWNDIFAIQNKVKSLTGENSMIFRFPGGSSNTISRFNPGIMSLLVKEAGNKGFHYFDWNVDSEDAGGARTSDEVYNNVIRSLGAKNNVVLMHDFGGNYKTLNAIRSIIRYGKNNGYSFEKISMATPQVHHRVAN